MDQWLLSHVRPIADSLIYSVLGAVVLYVMFRIFARKMPFSITKEIVEDQNVGLGIILGAIILGLSLIISAAIRG
jgi:putative membrane protein